MTGVQVARQPAGLAELFRTQFELLIRQGAAAADMPGTHNRAVSASDAFVHREVTRPLHHARNVCRYIPPLDPLRILDVGCGTGGLTVVLAAMFPAAAVMGVDIDPLTLQAARVRAAACDIAATFVQINAGDPLPFHSGAFDLVTCTSVLEFVTDPVRRREFAQEIVRTAQGYIVVTTPNPLFGLIERHSRRWLGNVRRRPDAPWASTRWELNRMFAPCEPVTVPGRVDDKLGVTLPRRLHPLVEAAMPWQLRVYRRPTPR